MSLEWLKTVLPRLTVWVMEAGLLLTLVGAWMSVIRGGAIRESFSGLNKRSRYAFLGMVLVSALFVAFVPQRTNRIFFDEQIYQSIGQSIALRGEAVRCFECDAELGELQVFTSEYNKQPPGHSYWLALFYRVFGVQDWVSHFANNVAYLLGAISVFGITYLVTGVELASFAAFAVFAATPMVAVWSNTAAAEPSTAATAALAFFSALLLLRKPGWGPGLMTVGAVALTVQFRPESLLILTPLAFLIGLSGSQLNGHRRLAWLLPVGALLILPLFLHLYVVRNENWGTSGDRFSWDIFFMNIRVNGPFYFLNERFPALFTFLAILGAARPAFWRQKIPLIAWFLVFWGVFLFFYAGSYSYGADVRYSLVSAAPLAVLAGIGLDWLFASRPFAASFGLRGAVIVLLAVSWLRFVPLIRAEGREAVHARRDIDYSRKLIEFIPENAIVLSHNPGQWLFWGINSTQTQVAQTNPEHFRGNLFSRYRGGVYFHWNYWCNVPDPLQKGYCDHLLQQYDHSEIKSYESFGHKFALYRIFPKGTQK